MRLNKYLSSVGYCSRREADRLIENREIEVNGVVAELGTQVEDGDSVSHLGKPVKGADAPVILLFNKPKGIVCTAERREKKNIIDFINYPVRIYNVGRLDKASRGLILLTNQGDLVNALNKASNYHEKEYVVRVDHVVTDEFIKHMSEGIYLSELEVTTRPCKVWKSRYNEFHIILTQGLNRQIRRMCQEEGYFVHDLRRIRIMNLTIDGLEEGKYRKITTEEERILKKDIGLL
jgi:23S rRNA pseudouridine2604 synthase